jgi:ribulose-5-phosphate 4-epimerase/fuculose-1-phosphate aldolase
MKNDVNDLLYYMGKVAERICFIEAAAGTSGNISVKVDGLPSERFPQEGTRNKTYHELVAEFPELYESRFLITGSGKNLRYVRERPSECLALIEIVEGGYYILWGLGEDEVITSEHPAHFATYQHRPNIAAFIHAEPTSVNVITRLFRGEDNLNRLLTVQHEQLGIFCPGGIGLVDTVEHGSYELASAVASSLSNKDICAVVRHGTFSIGEKDPINALNSACDLQEYYNNAAKTFLDNPWLRLLPMDIMMNNIKRLRRMPFGHKMVNALLRPPKQL